MFGYLTDGSVWSEWFLPGLHHGLGHLWPIFGLIPLAGLVLNLGRRLDPVLRVAALAALAAAVCLAPRPDLGLGARRGCRTGSNRACATSFPALVLGCRAAVATAPSRRGAASDPSGYA